MKLPATVQTLRDECARRGSMLEAIDNIETAFDEALGVPFVRLHCRLANGDTFVLATFEVTPLMQYHMLGPWEAADAVKH